MSKRGGHHGGAWKVAYADFVTAMMALFLVLWLSSQDQKIKEAVARSFTNPFANPSPPMGGPIVGTQKPIPQESRGKKLGGSESNSKIELEMLRQMNQDLMKSLQKPDQDEEDAVQLEMTPEGMRISIFDRGQKPIFETDTDRFTEYGNWVFPIIAWSIARFPAFTVELEGHTEKGHVPTRENYSNWELTADRANAARRKLLQNGVQNTQIRKVAGYADTQPLPNVPPNSESQRRVSIMLKVEEKK